MHATPLVSVIIPTFNRLASLRQAIQSVLLQDTSDIEVLICDDGSTDETASMVASLDDGRLRWLSGANSGGPAVPRNRGVIAARGQWLAFLDSDDQWYPTKLSEQLAAATAQGVRMSCTNAHVLTTATSSSACYLPQMTDRILTFRNLVRLNSVICSSMLVHSTVIEQIGLFPETVAFHAIEDYALWLAATMVDDIIYLGSPLTIYRDEPALSIRGRRTDSERQRKHYVLREALGRTSRLQRHRLHYRLQLANALLVNSIGRLKYGLAR